MRNVSYAAPGRATLSVNPLGAVNNSVGEGVGGYRYSVCSYNFDLSHGDLRCGKGFKSYALRSFAMQPEKIYHYRRFGEDGSADDRLLFYCVDKYIYEYSTVNKTYTKIPSLTFASAPEGVCYNFNGEDVIIFSGETGGMKIYDGNVVTEVPDAPTVSSMCVHNERLFITDGALNNSLWFSDDFDPTDWNVSLSEAGFIDMSGPRGRLLKVISFGGYLYVFRTYGITRVTAYGDQTAFSVSDLYVSSGRIYGDSITVCGDCVLFFASDGLYRFDGLSAKRISDAYREFIDFSYTGVIGGYYNGTAYFLMQTIYDGNAAKVILSVDPKNYADYYFIRGGSFIDTLVYGGENDYKFLALTTEGLYELSEDSKIRGVEPEKVWIGKFGDFGITARRKLLEYISFYTDKKLTVTVKADDKTYDYVVTGKTQKTEIRPKIVGDRFSVTIKSTESGSKVVGLTLKFSYYDD